MTLATSFEPHDRAADLFDHQVAELVGRMQAGRGRQVDLHHLALGGADSRNVVVGGQRLADVGRGEPVRPRAFADRARRAARTPFGRAVRRSARRPPPAASAAPRAQIIGDLVRRQGVAVKADIHGVDGLADLDGQRRLQRAGRQLIEDRIDLGVDLGQRLVGIVVEPQIDGDGADAALARRGHVVDAVGLRDGVFQRRGDEARDHVRIGAVVDRGDGDDGVFGARILQDRQHHVGAQPEHQDQQADDRGQHRPADENVGEMLTLRPPNDRAGRSARRPPSAESNCRSAPSSRYAA